MQNDDSDDFMANRRENKNSCKTEQALQKKIKINNDNDLAIKPDIWLTDHWSSCGFRHSTWSSPQKNQWCI